MTEEEDFVYSPDLDILNEMAEERAWMHDFRVLHKKRLGYAWTEGRYETLAMFDGDTPTEAVRRLIDKYGLEDAGDQARKEVSDGDDTVS